MKVIGREREKGILQLCLESKRPEFVAVYGRRRVGKTYLIREYFHQQFSFYATGARSEKTEGQLKAFHESLLLYGGQETHAPQDWFEAFSRLRALLSNPDVYRDPVSHKRVVFLDELPWMDTAKSDFKSALDYFWNSWGSAQDDLLLVVCGSATSWMIHHLMKDRKGLHNRLTRRIMLMPFSLGETEKLLEHYDLHLSREEIMDCWMIFGGIPYYLALLDPRLSVAQNVDELCFKPYGELHDEFTELFASLYKKPEKHVLIIKELSENKEGKSRRALTENPAIGGGAGLTKALSELEQCGFIRSYYNYKSAKEGIWYQVIDPFVLFHLRFLSKQKRKSWTGYLNSQGYASWRGNAFEILCLNHIPQIKAALGITGMETSEFSWRSRESTPGAQIDLLIDRSDKLIHLCEMKCTNDEFVLDKEEHEKLLRRLSVFQQETRCRKSIHLTLISARGLKKNMYSSAFQNVITGEHLFL